MITVFAFAVFIVVTILITPFISFICGWFTGWLIKAIFGTTFIAGLKLLNINLDINSIPLLFGTLNVIGMCFRSAINMADKDQFKNQFNKLNI